MNKVLSKYFYIIISVSIIFVVFSFIVSPHSKDKIQSYDSANLINVNSDWFYYNKENKCITISDLPKRLFFTDSKELTICRNFSFINDISSDLTLAFFSTYQTVMVYNDNELLYDSNNIYVPFGNSTGGSWHFITLPKNIQYNTFSIKLINDYNTTSYDIGNFYLGNINDIRVTFIRSQLPTLFVCIFLFIVGIFFIMMRIFFGSMSIRLHSLYYLGIFSLLTSFWTLVQTHVVQMFLPNQTPWFYLGYCITTLISLPLILFVQECYELSNNRLLTYLYIITLINSFMEVVLQALNILDFHQMALFNYGLFTFTLIYLLYQCGKYWKKTVKNKSLTTYVYAGCIPIIIASALIDICRFLLFLGSTSIIFLEYTLSIYILALAYFSLHDSLKLINAGIKAERFKMLAYIDALTGIRNRASFREYINGIPKEAYSMYSIVMLDMNDLKLLNDTYGHTAGDEYIIQTAHIISKVFSEYGMVCRLGGDEFCCVLKNISEMEYTQCIEMLKDRCAQFKSLNAPVVLSVAYGKASYDQSNDLDLIDTFNRADLEMYKNKQATKKVNK